MWLNVALIGAVCFSFHAIPAADKGVMFCYTEKNVWFEVDMRIMTSQKSKTYNFLLFQLHMSILISQYGLIYNFLELNVLSSKRSIIINMKFPNFPKGFYNAK